MESKVHETFGDVNRVNVCRLLEGPHVDDELVGHETLKKMFETGTSFVLSFSPLK